MTAFYPTDTIDVLKARAADDVVGGCPCVTVISDPNFIAGVEPCLAHLILGLQPTVEAFEPTL